MAQTAKSPNNLLMPSSKELDKALALSADRARRMAEAFGLKVPGIAEKASQGLWPRWRIGTQSYCLTLSRHFIFHSI